MAEGQRLLASEFEQDRAAVLARFGTAFETMVDWNRELGIPVVAYEALERGKARSLMDQLTRGGVDLLSGVDEKAA